MSLEQILAEIAALGQEDRIIASDLNQDEFLCIKILSNFPEAPPAINFEPTFIFRDNSGRPV